MPAHEKTLDDLRSLLLTKFYPMKIELVRNDQATAKLVAEYVKVMTQANNGASQVRPHKWTRFQLEVVMKYPEIQSLSNLTPDTIRRYIAELWANEAFRDHLKVSNVKDV